MIMISVSFWELSLPIIHSGGRSSAKIDNFHLKSQRGIRRDNTWYSSFTISIVWRASDYSFLSFLKLTYTFIPSFDNLANANLEF